MKYKYILTFFLAILSFSGSLYSQNGDSDYQEERITDFHSDIKIESSGRIFVSESIAVYAEGIEIKRGIFRRIPIYRTDTNGKRQKIDVKILSILRDGEQEEYRQEVEDGYRNIYIGNKDTYLTAGQYKYEIIYECYGHVSFFDDFDELYWNVTGNDWAFQIDKASATITLPQGASVINTACYTGSQGSTDKDCTYERDSTSVSFAANGKLYAHEGLTVAVSFPRDIVKRPPPPSQAELFWMQYRQYICGGIGLLILAIYYILTWLRAGRDPKKELVIPTFKPPHDWSPAAIRYLYKRKFDNKAFTATIINLAVKRYLKIDNQKKTYTLIKDDGKEVLPSEELSVYNTLFTKENKEITVSDTNHSKFSSASTQLEYSLKEKWNIKDYFLKNMSYIVWGGLLTIAVLIAYIIFNQDENLFLLLGASPFSIVGLGLIVYAIKGKGPARIIAAIMGLSFASSSLAVLQVIANNWVSGMFFVVVLISFGIYAYLIKAPTKLGAKTTAEIEGFLMYLKTAEEHRLNMLTPPEQTPELFEKMLPYAIALDVENEWGKKFDSILKQFNYTPEWYIDDRPFAYGMLANTLSHSFASSVSRAQIDPTPPSSDSSGGGFSGGSWSSGSGGGGFSGGGGGGGGGGGW